jgi:hypothetical protein
MGLGWREIKVPRLLDPSYPSSWAVGHLPSCSGRSDGSMTPPYPIRSLLGLGSRVHHRPVFAYVNCGSLLMDR